MIKPHGLSLNSKGAHGLRFWERRRTAHSEMAATPTTSGAGKKTQSAGINWSGRESVMMPQVSMKAKVAGIAGGSLLLAGGMVWWRRRRAGSG